MRNSKYTHITVGGVDYSAYLRTPLTIQQTLNEQLDSAVVELFNTPFSEPLKPFSPVVLGDMTYILAEDSVTEYIGQGLYKHSLTLIEQTKEAERIICGAKAFTRPLVHEYTDGKTLPRVSRFYNENRTSTSSIVSWRLAGSAYKLYPMRDDAVVGSIININQEGKIQIPKVSDVLFVDEDADVVVSAHEPNAKVYIYYNPVGTALKLVKKHLILDYYGEFELEPETVVAVDGYIWDTKTRGYIIPTNGSGVYTVRYEIIQASNSKPDFSFVYDVVAVDQPVEKEPFTVAQVINRMLETSETLREGLDSPRYRLEYTADQEAVMQQPAPELHFANGRSLWENLREIGRYIHAIPRITDGVLTFDQLGGTDKADLSKGQRVSGSSSLNIGEYTAGLDSMANNLINLDDTSDGSVTDPFDSGYTTMRAAEDVARIQEGTGVLLTTHPIEKIIKLELGAFTFEDKNFPVADLTAFLFEKQEYDLLSNYSGHFPTSKTYAIYYTQGQKNIDGFWYKAQDTGSDILNAFQEYSLTNIIEIASNVSAGFFSQLPYTDLAFRITYIPSVTARVRQYKPDYRGDFPSVIVHNQSANKLSAKAIGENLRGQLAMMSNTADTVTYMFRRVEDLPRAGTLYDDSRYITSITARIYNDFVVAQMSLAEGYNELGAFVEINNQIRQFEIPAGEDRYTVLEEFCVVSDKTGNTDDANTAATSALKNAILGGLSAGAKGNDASLAIVNTYDENGDLITSPSLALPVMTLALGTSLYFGFRFADNYSAGRKAVDIGQKYKEQDYVPYADPYYAEARTLAFSLVAGATAGGDSADSLPESTGVSGGTAMVSVGSDYPILWHKDSADAGCITYQLHMVTDSDLILGDGLTYWCEAVRKQPSATAAYIYFYDHRINQLTGTTDTANYLEKFSVVADKRNGRLYHTGVPKKAFKSWAIIKNGRFVMGKNSTELTSVIYFNFKRRLGQ